MDFKLSSVKVENVFLVIFAAVFLWFGYGNLSNHQITHDYPYGYLASDAFLHQTIAQAIQDQGNLRYHPWYLAGGYSNVVGYEPPLLGHISTLVSNFTKIPVYDIIYLMIFLMILLTVLMLYVLISKFNKNIALISIPITLLLFTGKFYIGFTWGQWLMYPGTLFLFGVFWVISVLKEKGIFILLGIFLAAAFLAHIVEAMWAFGFVIFYLLFLLLFKKLNVEIIKKVVFGGILSFILIFYYLPIFLFLQVSERSGSFFKWTPISAYGASYQVVLYTDFTWIFLSLIVLGIVFYIFFIKNKENVALSSSIFMVLVSFALYLGFDKAVQLRFLLPLYVAIFLGVGIYYLLKFFVKEWKIMYSIVMGIILVIVIPYIFYQEINTPGIMDPYHWELFTFLSEKTEESAKVYYFYGDTYNQASMLYNSKRLAYRVHDDDFISTLQNQTIKRYYSSSLEGEGSGAYPYKKSFIEFGHHGLEDAPENFRGLMDLCSLNYYVFDKISRQPALAEYNLAIREFMISNNATEVYQNQIVSVLQNNKVGGDCLG